VKLEIQNESGHEKGNKISKTGRPPSLHGGRRFHAFALGGQSRQERCHKIFTGEGGLRSRSQRGKLERKPYRKNQKTNRGNPNIDKRDEVSEKKGKAINKKKHGREESRA